MPLAGQIKEGLHISRNRKIRKDIVQRETEGVSSNVVSAQREPSYEYLRAKSKIVACRIMHRQANPALLL